MTHTSTVAAHRATRAVARPPPWQSAREDASAISCAGHAGAPNGWKITVALKELGYPHKLQAVALSKQEQKEDWFLKINPNGRIPAIGAPSHTPHPPPCAIEHPFHQTACKLWQCTSPTRTNARIHAHDRATACSGP